jgi:hypothetical protein
MKKYFLWYKTWLKNYLKNGNIWINDYWKFKSTVTLVEGAGGGGGWKNGIIDNGVDHFTTLDGTQDAHLYKDEYFWTQVKILFITMIKTAWHICWINQREKIISQVNGKLIMVCMSVCTFTFITCLSVRIHTQIQYIIFHLSK